MGVRPLQEGPLAIAYVTGLFIAGGVVGWLTTARAINLLITHKILPQIHEHRDWLCAIGLFPIAALICTKPLVAALIILGIYFIPRKATYTGVEFANAIHKEVSIAFFPKGVKIEGTVDLNLGGQLWGSIPEGFEVTQNLVLSNFEHESLPQNFQVGGNLELKWSKIKTLPENFVVNGNLIINDCPCLESLPKGLKVRGNLEIMLCKNFTSLPEDLVVDGDLSIWGCGKLEPLPKELEVGGNLHLSNTSRVILPDNFEVKKDLFISYSDDLEPLPKGLKVRGNLELRHLKIKSLPEDLQVDGNLIIVGCDELKSLPGLKVGGNLQVEKCQRLTSFGDNCEVKKDLVIEKCENLLSLSKGLKVGGKMQVESCEKLTSLPEDLEVKNDLVIKYCHDLSSLSRGLKVGGNLRVYKSQRLTSLPEDLEVGGNVTIHSCYSFESLPQRPLQIGGNLSLENCRSVTSVPDWVVLLGYSNGRVREIDLAGTGVPEGVINRLSTIRRPGVRIYYSNRAESSELTFPSLEAALEFWLNTANNPALTLPEITIDQHLDRVLEFLVKLTTTDEYKNQLSRPILGQRVIDSFTLMSQDETIKNNAVTIIYYGIQTCRDRVISAQDDIEVMIERVKLEKSNPSEEELKTHAKRFWAVEQVRKKADALIETLSDAVDPIEIHLAFKIGLADRFKLPISTRHMGYRESAQVTNNQIAAVGDAIEKSWTDEELNNYLQTWSPWTQFQKKKSFPLYENLKEDRMLQADEICAVMKDIPLEPVLYAERVYGYEAFKGCYLLNGLDPFSREKIDLKELRRLKPFQEQAAEPELNEVLQPF